MAVGDITTILTANMAGGDMADRQPGSGVEEMLLSVGGVDGEGSLPDIVPAINVKHIDGTNVDSVMLDGNSGNMATAWFRMKMVGDNTNYFRVAHVGSSTGDYTFAVIAVG